MLREMNGSSAVQYAAGFDNGITEPATSVDHELRGLVDTLRSVHRDLTRPGMIKAARITGTVENLRSAVQQLDHAIQIARDVNLLLEARASRRAPIMGKRVPRAR